jgi:hypothetical protein
MQDDKSSFIQDEAVKTITQISNRAIEAADGAHAEQDSSS